MMWLACQAAANGQGVRSLAGAHGVTADSSLELPVVSGPAVVDQIEERCV